VLTKNSQIEQIKIKDKSYDINVQKSWTQNDPTSVQYIKDRTHYKELLEASKIQEEAGYVFNNTYYSNGLLNHVDEWQPNQSWVYAANPCTCESITAHIANTTCSGCYYTAEVTSGQTTLFKGKIELRPESAEYTIVDINNISSYQQKLIEKGNPETWESIWTDSSWNADSSWNTAGQDGQKPTGLYTTWKDFKLWYCPDHKFYVEGEPLTSDNNGEKFGAQCILILKPRIPQDEEVDFGKIYKYEYVHRLDIGFLPLDYKTVKKDANGNLTVEDTYSADFKVTEQFGHYAPLSTVPAQGRSVKAVLRDAFCKDVQPTVTKPELIFTVAGGGKFEVGSTVNLTWKIQFDRGAYSYGTVLTSNGDKTEYMSNLKATAFNLRSVGAANSVSAKIGGESIVLDRYLNLTDSCESNNDIGKNYKTLVSNGTAEVVLTGTPINTFSLAASLNAECNTTYTSATMLEMPSNPRVEFNKSEGHFDQLAKTTSSTLITSDYRWFYGYNKTLDEVRQNPRALSSQLSGFPSSLTTDKLINAYFIAPKAKAANGIMMTNTATGASACKAWQSEEITLKDAGDNDQEYIIYYFENAAADSGKNTYKIEVIK
jgi:hypothetical protein